MELGKILVAGIVFVFGASLFPTLIGECQSYSGSLETFVHAFPIIYIITIAVFPILFLVMGERR